MVYGGSYLSIKCTIGLSDAVDSRISLTVIWRKDSNMMGNLTHRTVESIFPINETTYLSRVVFNPVQLGSDDGIYECEVAVNPQDPFLQGITNMLSNDLPIRTTGKTCQWFFNCHLHLFSYCSSNTDFFYYSSNIYYSGYSSF